MAIPPLGPKDGGIAIPPYGKRRQRRTAQAVAHGVFSGVERLTHPRTVNRWDKLERPCVILQNGHVTHFIFSVLDVPKDKELGNDRHGSKIIIVPIDGEALDRDLAEIVKQEANASPAK